MVTLQIETTSAWDALALARKIPRYHWYLVEPDPRHWTLCVPLDEPSTEPPADLRRQIEAWLRERNLERASVRAGDRSFELSPTSP